MTRPHHRRAIGATAAAALLLGGITSAPIAASAATPKVNLGLQQTGWYQVRDGNPVEYAFTITNHGTATAQTPTLQWVYKTPVQPKAETDGSYVNLHVKTPKAANCTTNAKIYTVTCKFKPLKGGGTTKVTMEGTADAKGATENLGGAYAMKLANGPIGKAPLMDANTGGWVISVPR